MSFDHKLRRKAEEQIKQQSNQETASRQPEDLKLRKMIEELRIHHIELELQNDELRRTRNELEVTRDRYVDLYDLAPVGYVTLDRQTRIVEANLTATSILGVNRSLLLNRTLTSFLDRDSQDQFFRNFQHCLASGERVACDLKLRTSGDTPSFVHLEGNMVESVAIRDYQPDSQAAKKTARQATPRCRIILNDITDRCMAEKALHAAHNQWERTFEAISDSVAIIDPDMKIIRANKAYAQLVNQSTSALVGKFCFITFRQQEEICSECPVVKVLATGNPETIELTNDALHRSFHLSVSPLPDENEQPNGAVIIIRDITRNKVMKKQLLQAQKLEAIGTLAGGIAHDFNNILTAIIGYSKLGLIHLPEDTNKGVFLDPIRYDKQRKYLRKIFSAGNRAGELVSQILAFSRRHDIVLQPVDPVPILKESIKFLRASLPSTITIEQSFPPEIPLVLADPTQIHQILINLCTNAAHAMREHGGTLRIDLRERTSREIQDALGHGLDPGRYLELRVSDTGHGMDEEQLAQIFDPFYTTKTKEEGTGLGLSVVHGIVAKSGGTIEVDSTPGKGTTFNVLLPIVQDEKNSPGSAAKVKPLPIGNEKILLIDDEEMLLEMTGEFLRLQGYRVVTRANGTDALHLFNKKSEDFDLVITDQTMPEMTGDQLARELLWIRPDIPIILTTGYSEAISKDQAKAIGIREFLMKPVVMDKLATTIRTLLDTPAGKEMI